MRIEAASFLQNLTRAPATSEHTAHPHLAELLAEAHCGTWLAVGGACKVPRPSRGTRPGTALADVGYNLLQSAIIREVAVELNERGMLLPPCTEESIFPGNGEGLAPLTDTIFMDGAALHIVIHDSRTAACDVTAALQVASDACEARSLQLSMGQGKVGVVVILAGEHSKAATHGVWIQWEGKLVPPSGKVAFVEKEYKRLGSLVTGDCIMGPEVAARNGARVRASGPLKKTIFNSLK